MPLVNFPHLEQIQAAHQSHQVRGEAPGILLHEIGAIILRKEDHVEEEVVVGEELAHGLEDYSIHLPFVKLINGLAQEVVAVVEELLSHTNLVHDDWGVHLFALVPLLTPHRPSQNFLHKFLLSEIANESADNEAFNIQDKWEGGSGNMGFFSAIEELLEVCCAWR